MDAAGGPPDLDPVAGRVLGSLIEKERTVPAGYPLTLNALVSAANQSTAREPVMAVAETDVLEAVEALRSADLVRVVHPRSGRGVVKYRHVVGEAWDLPADAVAVWSLLVLRGPQTSGELRGRADRLVSDPTYLSVDDELARLAERGLATRLDRRPGQSADRWTTGVGRDDDSSSASLPPSGPVATPAAATPATSGVVEELAELRAEVAALRRELDEVRRELGLG